MKITHINLAGGYRGGERQTELLIRALLRHGVSQRLVCSAGGELQHRFDDVPDLELRPIKKPFLMQGRHLDGDIVHAHENKGAHLAHAACLLGRRRPYVITRRIVRRPGNSVLTRDMYRRAAAVVGVCSAVSEDLAAYDSRIRGQTIYSVRSELVSDPEQAARIRQRFAGKKIILNMAALVMAQKGQHVLIEAARRLSQKHQSVVFLCCGDGADAAQLKEMASDLPNFYFEGFVSNVGDYMAAADIYVMPSLREGLGTVALDAMAFGMPVVASAVDGLPEIVKPDDTGLLVPAKDPHALSQALETLLQAPDAAQAMGRRAKAFSSSFSPASMAEAYFDVYQRALSL